MSWFEAVSFAASMIALFAIGCAAVWGLFELVSWAAAAGPAVGLIVGFVVLSLVLGTIMWVIDA